MKRRTPVPHVIVWAALRSAIRITDWARNAGPIVILSLVLLSAGAIWLASPTSAHFWVSKSWFRLFGGPQSLQAGGALGMPQSQDVESVSGYTLTTFDATGAGTVPASGTVSVHIDAAGDVVGDYIDNNNASHGFLRTANGTITNFDAPHAGSSTTEGTFVIGMDPGGNYIAGTYVDSGNGSHGFVRASDGVITEFDVGDSGPHPGDDSIYREHFGNGRRDFDILAVESGSWASILPRICSRRGRHGDFVRCSGCRTKRFPGNYSNQHQ